MKVLVCGGRDMDDEELVFFTLDQIHAKEPIKVVIEGGARGADRHAKAWAEGHGICVMTFFANWDHDGKAAAGPIRNARMLKYGQPDMVLAFPTPDSKGTWDMVRRTERAGIKLAIFEVGGSNGNDIHTPAA